MHALDLAKFDLARDAAFRPEKGALRATDISMTPSRTTFGKAGSATLKTALATC